jgi:diguanylate cyclase (GGDEF)-like protein
VGQLREQTQKIAYFYQFLFKKIYPIHTNRDIVFLLFYLFISKVVWYMVTSYTIEDSPQISIILDTKTNQVLDANDEALSLWGFADKRMLNGTPFPSLVRMDAKSSPAQEDVNSPVYASISLPDGFLMRVMLFFKALECDASLSWVNIIPLEELDKRNFPKKTGMFSALQRQLNEEKKYRRILDAAPVGLMLIDEALSVRKINSQMFALLDKETAETANESFGKLFNCSNAIDGNACGESEKCGECRLKNSLDAVLREGETAFDVEFEFSFGSGDAKDVRYLKLNMVPLRMEDARYAVVSIDDMTNRQYMKNRLETLSMTDELTGIPNRRGAMDFMRRSVEDMVAHASRLCLALVDLDDFKAMNDTYSHGFGDEVIRLVSEMISQGIRAVDFTGRFGGDEFLLLFPHTTAAQAKRILERVRQELKAKRIGGLKLNLAFSAGILEVSADKAREYSMDALLHSADVLLYKAKGEGKDRILTDKL